MLEFVTLDTVIQIGGGFGNLGSGLAPCAGGASSDTILRQVDAGLGAKLRVEIAKPKETANEAADPVGVGPHEPA